MNTVSATAKVPTEVQRELHRLAACEQYLSPQARTEITTRVTQWSAHARTRAAAPAGTGQRAPSVLLVMRPGKPPRPIDPLFFERI